MSENFKMKKSETYEAAIYHFSVLVLPELLVPVPRPPEAAVATALSVPSDAVSAVSAVLAARPNMTADSSQHQDVGAAVPVRHEVGAGVLPGLEPLTGNKQPYTAGSRGGHTSAALGPQIPP